MKNEQVYESLKKYAAMLAADGYIECGYIAAKADNGLYITTPDANFADLAEEQVAFVTDKSVEELEGNFRAAAVLLICALKSKQEDGAAAIVDSKSILEFSSKKITLPPILEDMAQINGVSVRAAKQNTAAEVVNALSGARNACFLPDAGAVVTGRTLAEVYTCALVLDKASNGWLLAEPKGGAQHLNAFEAWLEHMVYKLKYSKKNQTSQKAAEEGKEVDTAEKPSAIDTDELKAVAQEIKDAGVKLLEEIAELQREQEQVEEEVKTAKFWVNPIEQDRLVREAAAIVLDIDQQSRDLEDLEESIFKHQMSIVEKVASEEYAVAMSCDMEARVAQQCRNHLKQQLDKLRNSMNEAPSGENGKRTSAANQIAKTNDPVTELLAEKTELLLELEEARLKKKLAEMHRRAAIKSTFRMVTNLNDILERMKQETVDLNEIKKKCGIDDIEAEEAQRAPVSRPRTAVSKTKHATPRIEKKKRKRAQ